MRRQRGFGMIWAMFLVVLVGALGAVVLERDVTVRREGQTDEEALQSFHAAAGGLARARHELARNPRWRGGAFDVGSCHVIVHAQRDARTTWRVRVDATPGSTRLEAILDSKRGLPTVRRWEQVR